MAAPRGPAQTSGETISKSREYAIDFRKRVAAELQREIDMTEDDKINTESEDAPTQLRALAKDRIACTYAYGRDFRRIADEIEQLRQEVAERDARIAELEQAGEAIAISAKAVVEANVWMGFAIDAAFGSSEQMKNFMQLRRTLLRDLQDAGVEIKQPEPPELI